METPDPLHPRDFAGDELDRRLREALRPPAQAAQRVARSALRRRARERPPRRLLPSVVALAALALLAGVLAWQNRERPVPAPKPAALVITNVGRLVVARSADGDLWIQGAAGHPAAAGSHVLLYQGGLAP